MMKGVNPVLALLGSLARPLPATQRILGSLELITRWWPGKKGFFFQGVSLSDSRLHCSSLKNNFDLLVLNICRLIISYLSWVLEEYLASTLPWRSELNLA